MLCAYQHFLQRSSVFRAYRVPTKRTDRGLHSKVLTPNTLPLCIPFVGHPREFPLINPNTSDVNIRHSGLDTSSVACSRRRTISSILGIYRKGLPGFYGVCTVYTPMILGFGPVKNARPHFSYQTMASFRQLKP